MTWPGKACDRECLCGGVGAERRIKELEAARDQLVQELKRLRERLPKGDTRG